MIDESNMLCDRLKSVVDDAVAIITSDSMAEKQKQLREIGGTIANLERVGVSVPQELNSLAEHLTQEVAQHDQALGTLKSLYDRVIEIVESIEPHVRERSHRKRAGRQSFDGCTPRSEYGPVIIEVLKSMGGRGSSRQVIANIYDRMSDRLTPEDHETYGSGDEEIWRVNAKRARFDLLESGLLRADSPQQHWELTETAMANGES
jgi:hypothetical protein